MKTVIDYKTFSEIYDSGSTVNDYFALLKPRVMTLVIFTAIAGLLIAPGTIHPFIGFVTIACVALGSGAAGCLNMWYERDIDAIMERTKNRPIVTGKISPDDALHFGILISSFAVILMGLAVNVLAAAILLLAILFYLFVYTIFLKRRTAQNIVIGGAAGAFPPVIGWVAVTNQITLEPIFLFLIIFLWTAPHFWALALYKSTDYAKANIPMMPVLHGDSYTKKNIVFYTILTFICVFAHYYLFNYSLFYLTIITGFSIKFAQIVFKLYFDKKNKSAPKLFGFSMIYLFVIYLSMVIDRVVFNGF